MRAVPLNTVHLPKAVGRVFNQRQGRRDSHPPKVSFHPALETTARPHPEARRKARHERAPASRSTPHLSPTPAPRPQSPGAVGVWGGNHNRSHGSLQRARPCSGGRGKFKPQKRQISAFPTLGRPTGDHPVLNGRVPFLSCFQGDGSFLLVEGK